MHESDTIPIRNSVRVRSRCNCQRMHDWRGEGGGDCETWNMMLDIFNFSRGRYRAGGHDPVLAFYTPVRQRKPRRFQRRDFIVAGRAFCA